MRDARRPATLARLATGAGVLVLAGVIAGCSDGGSPTVDATASSTTTAAAGSGGAGGATTTTAAGASVNTNKIDAKDFTFTPAAVTVAAGTLVQWKNGDDAPHAIADDGGAFNAAPVNPGGTFSQRYPTAGTFPYHCTIHPSMTGTVTVSG